jgi:plastocyanin
LRKLIPLALLAAAALPVAAATGHDGPEPDPKTYTIKVGDDFFSPTKKTIHKRDVLKWVWVGADRKPGETVNEHTVVEATGEKLPKLNSGTKRSGTYRFRFKKVGSYRILCADHPEDMILKVKVKD